MPDAYDYVIVGAGSAGCVLANRLSTDPNASVLLLEAGGHADDPRISDPRAWSQLWKSPVDWCYATEPEVSLNGRSIYWPRGKVLGGTSSINAMVYIRGNAADYDNWASLGNQGWAFRDVLPYFKRSENNTRGDSEYHGAAGPLPVCDPRSPHATSLMFLEAASALGYERNADFNAARQFGAGLYQRTMADGKRASAARAFIDPVVQRGNLKILVHAEVSRLIIDNRRTIAVRYRREGKEHEARAKREIIVSAGAINSPKLLMLSGIGPADHLQGLGIPVVLDLPGVGRNLQDHPRMPVRLRLAKPPVLDAESNIAEAGLFCNASAGSTATAPELQYHFAPLSFMESREGQLTAYCGVSVNVSRPVSRGSVRLRSSDPSVAAVIQPSYLSQRADMDLMIEGLRIGRALMRTRIFEGAFVEETIPGARVADDAASLERAIREHCDTVWHPVGTCKMGNDAAAVVDPRLCVRGLDNLRVVDASVMPQITTGNTHAPSVMIAEKAAAMIAQ